MDERKDIAPASGELAKNEAKKTRITGGRIAVDLAGQQT